MAARSVAATNKDFVLRKVLLSEVSKSTCNLVAKLNLTIKTHKEAGEVVPRAIHSYSACALAPGMRWLSRMLRVKLSHLPHLLIDSDHLIRLLRNFRLPATAKFLRFDVKDFYMTGSHDFLVEHSAAILDVQQRADYRSMCSAILCNQYIQFPSQQSTYKVTRGAGMGMICSGDSGCRLLQRGRETFLPFARCS